MKKIAFASILVIAVGCAPKSTTVAVAPTSDPAHSAPLKLHPLTEDPDYIKAHPKKSTTPNTTDAPVEEPKGPSKIDPAVLGAYKFRISDEQKALMRSTLEDMEKKASAGDANAKQSLDYAKAAFEMADNMTITLQKDGKYSSNLGSGASIGTFKMYGKQVILKPNEQVKDKSMPTDVSMDFDKSKKTLTVNFRGQLMVFEPKV